ncbi:MAG: GGDEF domain-containing protein [Acidobacteria bacterium]|nr:GGDEF domain-containing protein [Acidobacteriota bacterium]
MQEGTDRVGEATENGELLAEACRAFHAAEYAAAESAASRALEAIRASGVGGIAEAEALTWIGAALTQQSRYQEALVRLKDAEDRYRAIGRPELASRALNYLAVVHEELGDVDKALEIYARAEEAARNADNVEMLARVLANVGEAYVNLRRWEGALASLGRSAALLAPLTEHRSLFGWSLLGIARVYVEIGEHATALEVFSKALDAAREGESLRVMAEIHTAFGSLLTDMGDQKEAIVNLRQALALAEEAGVPREIFSAHLALSRAYEKFGEYRAALEHFRHYHQERGRVFDELAKEKIDSLTAEIELVKVRHEQEVSHLRNVELGTANALLERQKGDLERANELLEKQAAELDKLSVHDSLTGVNNRRYLDRHLAEEMERSRRHGHALSIAMIDADHFKDVNDRFSHRIGDVVLRTLMEIVCRRKRRTDAVARYGGEEFVIVFPETPIDQAAVAAEGIRLAIESYDWSEVHPQLRLTVSIGVASNDMFPDPQSLLDAADKCLYEAKSGGRNRVVARRT